jgi:non-ribosomal peptide synthase protein (TIGR01720 family)
MERDRLLLEVGPGRTLSTLVGRHSDRTDQHALVSSMRSAAETRSDRAGVLDALGRVWAAGSAVDWMAVHAGERRRRVPIPTYPFERQRYWIEPQRRGGDARRPEALRKKSDIANWFYYPSWKRTQPPVLSDPDETAERPACWLVFTDPASGLGANVVTRLDRIGNEVLTVAPGEHFARLGDRAFSIDPRNAAHYTALVGELAAGSKAPDAILHLWGVGPRREIPSNDVDFGRAQDRGFYSLLFLARALGSQHRTDPVHGTVVTSDIQDVTGEEALCPEKATVPGACKVIPQEYPNITCRHVDIAAPPSGDWQADEADRIVAEALAQSTDVVVALRGNRRWVQIFEPVGQKRRTDRATRLRERGVYLITGGLGGVGLEVATYLARVVHARLILTGRSTMPESDGWEEWLATHDVENDVSRKIRKVRALEALGAEVLIATADVADPEQMKALVRRAEAQFGPMNGVIHAAGAEKRLHRIQETGRPEWEEQLRPKLTGLIVLDDVLRERHLDFRLLQSSLSSVLGAVGMVAYTAAHLFMDALASKRNRTAPGCWTVVNWDNWLTWKEVDQGVTPSETSLFMTPDEGAEALHHVLSMGPIDHVVVSTGPLQSRIDQWVKLEFLRQEERPQAEASSSAHSRPSLKTAYVAPATEAEKVLADIWAKTLGFDRVGIHDNFFELGGDSVLTLQIIAKASKAGLQITHQRIFARGTVAELAALARPSRTILVDQGPVTGPVPLTPIQQWFFDRNLPDSQHYNLPVVLDVPHGTDPRLLERAIQAVALHHDALRLRFVQRGAGWHQVNAGAGEAVPFARLDLSGRSDADQAREMEAAAAQLQTSLNLTDGPLMRAAFFELAAPQSSRLVLVAHHLLVDVVSWRTVLEDLETAYGQLGRGEAVDLPPKTTSFKHWADGLAEYAQSAAARSELPYWLALSEARISSLPVDVSGAPNTDASRRVLSISLSADQTRALLQEAPAVYNVQAHEVLLTALVQAAACWTGVGSLLVDLEGHGREGIVAGVDLSRTVGWFTTIFPMLLDLEGTTHPGEALKAIKEQIRQLPARGVGYGVLRYLTSDPEIARSMQTVPRPEISFLYLGQVDHNATAAARFKVVHEPMGPSCSALAIRSHLLQVMAQVVDGRLRMDWAYSDSVHKRATIERLAEGLIESLDLLFTHCRSSEATSYTPSDFPGAKLSQEDLDRLIAQIH